jgi:hypothetical protein
MTRTTLPNHSHRIQHPAPVGRGGQDFHTLAFLLFAEAGQHFVSYQCPARGCKFRLVIPVSAAVAADIEANFCHTLDNDPK